jgi:hypothetical protein
MIYDEEREKIFDEISDLLHQEEGQVNAIVMEDFSRIFWKISINRWYDHLDSSQEIREARH